MQGPLTPGKKKNKKWFEFHKKKQLKTTILRNFEITTWNIPELLYNQKPLQPENFADSESLKILAFCEHQSSRIDRKRVFRDH